MSSGGRSKATSLAVLVATLSLATAWAWFARWTTLDCSGATCTITSRRLLTAIHRSDVTAPRGDLEVGVAPISKGAEVFVVVAGERVPVALGWTSEMADRAVRLRADLADPAREVHEAVAPHAFGFVALGVLLLLAGVGARQLVARR